MLHPCIRRCAHHSCSQQTYRYSAGVFGKPFQAFLPPMPPIFMVLLWFCALLPLFCGASFAVEPSANDFTVAGVFTDHMVLQQNEPICIWGTSPDEGAVIGAKLADSYGFGTVTDGQWRITLAARCTSTEAFTLEVFGSSNARHYAYEDILIGDVWLVIGQSNIEYSFASLSEEQKPMVDGSWENISRILSFDSKDVTPAIGLGSSQTAAPFLDRYTPHAKHWHRMAHAETLNASALSVCLAQRLCRLSSGQIPVGMVSLGFAGTELISFVQPENAEKLSGYGEKSRIYDNFIQPLIPFPIRGVIWYQGEANAAYYTEYTEGFLAFAEKLRSDKAQTTYSDFPFYIIELPPCFPAPETYADAEPWQYTDFGMVRAASGVIPSKLTNSYICATSDLWSDTSYRNNLHPNNKPAIAERLSQMIAANEWEFSEYLPVIAPSFQRAEKADDLGQVYRIYFDHVGEALHFLKDLPKGFDAIGEDWAPLNITCEICAPNCVQIRADRPIYRLRYAPQTSSVFGTDATLCNSAGIPACAFFVEVKAFPVKLKTKLYIFAIQIYGALYRRRYLLLPLSFLLIGVGIGLYLWKKRRKKPADAEKRKDSHA